MKTYRSGHNGTDSKFLETPAVSSAENVHRTGLCAGSDFTILYCSCVFFLHSSGARITLEIYGELSERSKVRHSKCRVPKRNLGFESLTLRQKSPKNQGFSGFSFLLVCSKSAQNYGKNSLFFGKNKAILGILAYSNRKNQFFPSSAEISAHLLPKFTDSGSAIPLTIAFAEDSFEV